MLNREDIAPEDYEDDFKGMRKTRTIKKIVKIKYNEKIHTPILDPLDFSRTGNDNNLIIVDIKILCKILPKQGGKKGLSKAAFFKNLYKKYYSEYGIYLPFHDGRIAPRGKVFIDMKKKWFSNNKDKLIELDPSIKRQRKPI